MELKQTDHSYYCRGTNYYAGSDKNHGRSQYETWADFKEEWFGMEGDELGIDIDYNLCFRYDILQKCDNESPLNSFELWLFFILQRKGIYRPVWIKKIEKEDIPELESFLKNQWDYMKNQWIEIDNSG